MLEINGILSQVSQPAEAEIDIVNDKGCRPPLPEPASSRVCSEPDRCGSEIGIPEQAHRLSRLRRLELARINRKDDRPKLCQCASDRTALPCAGGPTISCERGPG